MERDATTTIDPEALAAIGCEIGARPKGAPHFGDVAGAVRVMRRERGALVVDYDPAAAEAVAAIVEAERLCCPNIGWLLERPDPAADRSGDGWVRLRVEADAEQLDVMQSLFDAPRVAAKPDAPR